MSCVDATRPHRGSRRAAAAIGAAIALSALLTASDARGWSTPQPFYTGAARDVFSIAGDPAGNAFAIIVGESLDKPLLLMERWAAGNDKFVWSGAQPLPGGARNFTNPLNSFDSFQAAAAGDGIGLVVWREVLPDGTARLFALTREPPLRFAGPLAVAGADLSPRADPSASVNASGDALVAFRIGRGKSAGRTAFALRRSPRGIGRPRTLSAGASGKPVAAIGDDGSSVVAWIRGGHVESRRLDSSGKALSTQRLGNATADVSISTAVNHKGAGVIAWQDDDGAIRSVRRAAPGPFSSSRRVRAVSRTARVDGLATGVDARGRTFVAWRERTSSTRRVLAASAVDGGAFKTTSLASGQQLGAPSLTMRPGGGAIVSLRSPTGWQARIAPRSGVFTDAMTVSRALFGGDLVVARAATLAGPTNRVDLVWPQAGDPPDPSGFLIYQSFQDEEAAPAG